MITIRSLRFGYGKTALFQDLDLELRPGGVHGLLGLNAAGKTTLLKLMAGALFPDAGGVRVFGRDPGRREAAHLADVAFVEDNPPVPDLKMAAWLKRYAVFWPRFDQQRFRELAAEFALEEDKPVSRYSHGQQKKFALAAALSTGARLIMLDEPTNGLDIPSKGQVRRVLAGAATEDRVIVLSTHQVRDLESLIDPVIILHQGRVRFQLPAEVLASRLCAARLPSLDGRPVIHAERDAMGWNALLAEPGAPADLELVFNAALARPERLSLALAGSALPAYPVDDAIPAARRN